MSRTTITMTEALERYVDEVSPVEHPALTASRQETLGLGAIAIMQISQAQGHFMALLTRLSGAQRHLEIGTFTGYSAAVVALAMPATGRVATCDVSLEWTTIARRLWSACGIADRIDLHIAPGLQILDRFVTEGAVFDSLFIDADKLGYDSYYERGLKLLRTGGLMFIDNTLWHGAVINKADDSADTIAIRRLNQKLATDGRVDMSVVPIGDGLTLVRKR